MREGMRFAWVLQGTQRTIAQMRDGTKEATHGHTGAQRGDRRHLDRGILIIIGIVVAIFWSVVIGIILILIGLIAFGGFARGRRY